VDVDFAIHFVDCSGFCFFVTVHVNFAIHFADCCVERTISAIDNVSIVVACMANGDESNFQSIELYVTMLSRKSGKLPAAIFRFLFFYHGAC
jgi:hypothetical protein